MPPACRQAARDYLLAHALEERDLSGLVAFGKDLPSLLESSDEDLQRASRLALALLHDDG